MLIELSVYGKRVQITDHEVIIWRKECWDGEDQEVLEELIKEEDSDKFAFYDRTDGAPYYWYYHDEDIVDIIDTLIAPIELFQLRHLENGIETMSTGRNFRYCKDSIGMDFLEEEYTGKVYWIKEVYISSKTGEVRGYAVTEA